MRDFKYLLVPVSLEDYESVDSLVQQLTENREIQNKPHKSHLMPFRSWEVSKSFAWKTHFFKN